jgi:hypothetical protein
MRVSFSDHIALLSLYLDAHSQITDAIESRLLTQRAMESARGADRRRLEQALGSAFASIAAPRELLRLHGQLAAAHLADGFEPAGGQSHALDPTALVVHAWQHWQRHRWPGRNVRLVHARTVYAVHLLRQLELLSLRIWDEDSPGNHLRSIQQLLDRLNGIIAPAALVRDARWLIQTAQGPLTRHLAPYFRIAAQVDDGLPLPERVEVHRAGAVLAGGHLRSQLRQRSRQSGRPSDDPEVLAIARNSNSMDAALLVRDLVSLLEAYESPRDEHRLALADAILQGLSADPDLLLTRLDLLGPCTAIEHLFVDRDEHGSARFTPMGDAHRQFLQRYSNLIGRLSAPLEQDAVNFDPSQRAYSPLGLVYGFCEDVVAAMAADGRAFGALPTGSSGLSLEDLFESRDDLDAKLARVAAWQPQKDDEGAPLTHTVEWAKTTFERTMRALRLRAAAGTTANASGCRDARLFVVVGSVSPDSQSEPLLPESVVRAQEHCVTSDLPRAMSSGATAFPRSQILADRGEGRFLASVESEGRWFGVSKTVLTMCTAQGNDALLTGVPPGAVDVLRLTCPDLLLDPLALSERK